MIKFRIVAIVCALAFSGACSKEKEEKKGLPPAEDWQAPSPSAAGTAGGQQANPHAGMQGSDPHAGMQGSNPHAGMQGSDPHAGMQGSDPHAGMQKGSVSMDELGLEPPDPDREIDPNKFLKGTIKPAAETKDVIPKGAVIFISVKRADPETGAPTGAPLAVKRLRLSTWPLWFQLTEEDAMVSGTQFEGEVVITAWADQDQDAISKSPGDVLGMIKAKIPAKDLLLELDTVIKK